MILFLWRLLVVGWPHCQHKWQEIRCQPYSYKQTWFDEPVSEETGMHMYTLRCEKCGKMDTFIA